jgi:2-dehydropantoate 2-reductase
MRETESVASKLGIDIGITIEQRLDGAEKVGHHKTSMLQDIEAGKPTELEAIVGAVIELGDKLRVELPHTKSVYACVKLLESARDRILSPRS